MKGKRKRRNRGKRLTTPSRVTWESHSKYSAPWFSASLNALMVFSGNWPDAPRWATALVCTALAVEIRRSATTKSDLGDIVWCGKEVQRISGGRPGEHLCRRNDRKEGGRRKGGAWPWNGWWLVGRISKDDGIDVKQVSWGDHQGQVAGKPNFKLLLTRRTREGRKRGRRRRRGRKSGKKSHFSCSSHLGCNPDAGSVRRWCSRHLEDRH